MRKRNTVMALVLLCTSCMTLNDVPTHPKTERVIQHQAILGKKGLRIVYLGTSSYLFQYHNTTILTDPFYSQPGFLKIGFSKIHSNRRIVHQVVKRLSQYPAPVAILVGHAHYDHLLDAATLIKTAHWRPLMVVGSQTTQHILMGYHLKTRLIRVVPRTLHHWQHIAPHIRYQAILAEHAPQLPGWRFYGGKVSAPLSSPPQYAKDFKLGQTYAYLFQFGEGHHAITVYFTDAATRAPIGFPDFSIHAVDIAILCTPSWQYTRGYPQAFIKRLRPRYIIPSHYNDFFQTLDNFNDTRRLLVVANLPGFLRTLTSATNYPRFKKILIPQINASLLF